MKETHPFPWKKIYQELNIQTPEFPGKTVAEHIRQHATEKGDSVAIDFLASELTFSELEDYANRFANLLLKHGCKRGDVIGIHLPNCPQWLIAIVGISKIGCVISGISPLLAPSEIAYQVNDSGIKLLLSTDSLATTSLSAIETPTPCLETVLVTKIDDTSPGEKTPAELPVISAAQVIDFRSSILKSDATPILESMDEQEIMAIMYTGGTTGPPKGAELTMYNMMYNIEQLYAIINTEIEGNVMTPSPIFHVAGMSMIILILRLGLCTVLVPNPRELDTICSALNRRPPSYFAAVPTLYQMLYNREDFRSVDFSKLVIAGTGAAPITQEQRNQLSTLFGKDKFFEVFGMTETSPTQLGNPKKRFKQNSVGIPIPETEVRIVDLETGTKEMPFGEPGEIICRGPQIMKGYHGKPKETANALKEFRGHTWMYTGDIGHMDEEGYVFIRDRAKDMLVVGGFKVFSVEVEDKLKNIPWVLMSAVVGIPDEARPGNDLVHLVVQRSPEVSDRDEESLREELISFCRKNMAPYKIPKVIIFADAIPLTGVGKLDKKLLRQQVVEGTF